MASSSARQKALVAAAVFAAVPCILGLSIALYLKWGGTIWLTSAGGFWPIACLGLSIASLIKRAVSPFEDRMAGVGAWLMIAWTSLYFPLWLTALSVPQSSAVISPHGRVYIASEWARNPTDTVWLLTGKARNRIVRNVAGTLNIKSMDVQYRYKDTYIATRGDNEDLAKPIADAADAILSLEAAKPRASRIAVLDKREVQDRLLDSLCRAAVPASTPCPLKLSLLPQVDATLPGSVWSKTYTEQEAVDEQHLPTLIQLLTQENSRLVDRDRVFALLMDLAVAADDLAKVARKSRMLNERQFDDLIKSILVLPGGADEAVGILIEAVRLKQDQRQNLRAKVFREARIELIVKNIVPLRISDAEVAQLAVRMRAAFATNPGIAALALDNFGERIPSDIQHDAVRAIVNASAPHAIAALEHLNFAEELRVELLRKVLKDASCDDFNAAHISREKLGDMLAPDEMRLLIESAIKKSDLSAKWLDFAVHMLPIRLMTAAERKSILSALLFVNYKSALEFVSENRSYLEAADVDEITRDYTRTIAPDMCLHLSHRNKTRKVDYFSENQLQIFRDCAQPK